ncbi:nucleoside phosphorylase domain-containing protein [Aspergillus californicus]
MHPQPHEFEFAVICALPCEFNAFDALFDEHYTNLATKRHHGDSNFYQTGRIGALNVVLTCLSEMGKTRAANAASGIRFSFPNVSLTLVVGICGGVPFPTKDTEMVLGDVIISDQVVKYDFGRQYPDRFEQKGVVKSILDPRNEQVQSLLSGLQTRRMRDRFQEKHTGYLQALHRDPLWKYPGIDRDQLYSSSCQHNSSSEGCTGERIVRQRLNTGLNPQPCLHFGAIASGDTVMKSAEYRDSLSRHANVIGFEMESAGTCEALSSLVIKGVCDYADSHKNKDWQGYAAASAACCAKVFLESLAEIQYQQWNRAND